ENHDEVRIANPNTWGGHGMAGGRPATAFAFLIGPGPVMLYHGQEVGEPAIGASGFSGDDGRTSIFDYVAMPEFQKWVNGGKFDGGLLSNRQLSLRDWYLRLIKLAREPAFANGTFYGLNHFNRENPGFGRLDDESHSGR